MFHTITAMFSDLTEQQLRQMVESLGALYGVSKIVRHGRISVDGVLNSPISSAAEIVSCGWLYAFLAGSVSAMMPLSARVPYGMLLFAAVVNNIINRENPGDQQPWLSISIQNK